MEGARANTSTQLVCVCLSSQKLNDALYFSFFNWQTSNTKVQLVDSSFTNFSHFHTVSLDVNIQVLNTAIHKVLCWVNSKEKKSCFLHFLANKFCRGQPKHPEACWRKAAGFQPSRTLITGTPRSL